ncbi:hypothetical protein TNCV_888011 [Trichonephila clavipes]|nr:hypothetical protein TNCV_888011 [Trichonephila clavipes]
MSSRDLDCLIQIFLNSSILTARYSFIGEKQGHSYRRINRINDTGLPSYRGPNMCSYSRSNRAPHLKMGLEGILEQAPRGQDKQDLTRLSGYKFRSISARGPVAMVIVTDRWLRNGIRANVASTVPAQVSTPSSDLVRSF